MTVITKLSIGKGNLNCTPPPSAFSFKIKCVKCLPIKASVLTVQFSNVFGKYSASILWSENETYIARNTLSISNKKSTRNMSQIVNRCCQTKYGENISKFFV